MNLTWIELERFYRVPASLFVADAEENDTDFTPLQYVAAALGASQLEVMTVDAADRRSAAYKKAAEEAKTRGLPLLLAKDKQIIDTCAPKLVEVLATHYGAFTVPLKPHESVVRVTDEFSVTATEQLAQTDKALFQFRFVDDVSAFPQAVWSARYDRMAAWMQLAARRTDLAVCIAVIDKKGRACVYEIASSDLAVAMTECYALLRRLALAVKTNFVPTVKTTPSVLTRPGWMTFDAGVTQDGYQLWR